jgi:hypothetical protein
MFKSECEYLLKRAHRGDYERLLDDILNLYWRIVVRRIVMEDLMFNTVEDVLWLFHFELMLERLIWGWYGAQTFSTRYMRGEECSEARTITG